MNDGRPYRLAEGVLLVLFLAWLCWLPLPFGSVIERAWLPLIAVPLALCGLAALIRFDYLRRSAASMITPTAWRFWSAGSALFVAVIVLQLIPLPPALLRNVSPHSAILWAGSDRIATLLGASTSGAHPISVNPGATLRECFRMLALLATFHAAALLVRTHARRIAFAVTLIAAGTFEVLYGINEAALGRYEIWGWKNRLIFNRVTGTFVNPNHFAHYLAILVPMAMFLVANAWHNAAPGAPFGRRMTKLLERQLLPFGIGVLGAFGFLAAILVAQSRGALLAVFGGIAVMSVIGMQRSRFFRSSRRRRMAFAFGSVAVSVVAVAALVVFLGRERTIERFTTNDVETTTLVGRTVGYKTALGVWKLFPLFGSGAGSFADVASMAQRESLDKLYNHAHNDYLEVAATTGFTGIAAALIALIAGFRSVVRITFGDEGEGSFRHRAFQAAALTSIAMAMVHALFDFNFFIPSNPATLAAIAGAAVAMRVRSLDPDSTADRVPRHRVRKVDFDAADSA